ncbi:MAG: spermidine synthase [bacterium]|nr:spermidine synthase [bacterium]
MAPSSFKELDYGMTPLGELTLRRREVLSLDGIEVFEVKLDGQFLMSSLVNDAEIALATFALPLLAYTACDVLVGGLGLGYTPKAALDSGNVRSVTVIEYLARVIDWHRRGLVPLARQLTDDPRCSLIQGDFFATIDPPTTDHVRERPGDDTQLTSDRFHAILLDIDHSPQCLLQPSHAAFYTPTGLRRLTDRLHPGGIFALWSADPPEGAFVDGLESAFSSVQVHESKFYNPLLNEDDVNYIFVARLD